MNVVPGARSSMSFRRRFGFVRVSLIAATFACAAIDVAMCAAQAVAPPPTLPTIPRPTATRDVNPAGPKQAPRITPPITSPAENQDPRVRVGTGVPTFIVRGGDGFDAAVELNLEFRAAYARARSQVLAKAKPVIFCDGDKLTLIADGKRTVGESMPIKYHRLKTIAHLPFMVYLTLREPSTKPFDGLSPNGFPIETLVMKIEKELPTYDLTPEELERQKKIVADCDYVIRSVRKDEVPTHRQLIDFARKMGPLQEANAEAAAAIELDHYRKQADAWRTAMGEETWKEVSVVIGGGQMPRKRNRMTQLFAAMLGVPGEGKRIIYAEGLYDIDKALNLFATHHLDAESAAAFFDDPARLDEDLLSRGAAKYVEEHFPKAGAR